jgi:hypothetical protein
LAGLPTEVVQDPPQGCAVPGCELWTQPSWPFCRSHGRSWIYHGRPHIGDYLSRFDEFDQYVNGVPAYEHIDLRGLPTQLKLEMQYVLQRRRDDETIKTPPAPVRGVIHFLLSSQITSFLDWSEHTWKRKHSALGWGVSGRAA